MNSTAEQLRPVAREFVAQTFFLPLMRQVRETAFTSETSKMLNGGRGGDAFRSMLDEVRARNLANGPGSDLAEAIVRKLG